MSSNSLTQQLGSVAPLFRVFVNPDPAAVKGWRVCSANLDAEPVTVESEHEDLTEAIVEAGRLNFLCTGVKPDLAVAQVTQRICFHSRLGGR